MRNKLFDWNILPQHEFDVPLVVVGNLAVGGTGKTPHTEYIVDALRLNYHIAVLSRGYKRSTKGFVLATPYSKPSDIGDEAYQIYHKFDKMVTVAVCEDRVHAISELLRIDPDINLVVLDDAFQHRYVKPAVSILITEYDRPIYKDKMMPYGRLREPLRGVNRADMVVVSKCPPAMTDLDYSLFKKNLKLFPYQDLFFSRYSYQDLVPLFPDQVQSIPYLDWMTAEDSILAVAGIGNPRPFVRHIKSFMPKVRVNIFSDHHNFTRKDMELLLNRYKTMKGEHKVLITTEKDAVRMASNPYFPPDLRPVTFYLPVKVEFSTHSDISFADALRRHLRDFLH
jgi:tetraacyldisaccharide 4'-kinase